MEMISQGTRLIYYCIRHLAVPAESKQEQGDSMTVITGTSAGDELYAGEFGDEIYGLDGDDLLIGSAGDDILAGGEGNDQLYGGEGDDWLEGGDGSDWLEGGGGEDTMVGRDGDDFYLVEDENDIVVEASDGGLDTVYVTAAQYTLAAGVENAEIMQYWELLPAHSLTGNALSNYVIVTYDSAQTVDGADGVDTVSYERDPFGLGVLVDLATGVNGGIAEDDVLVNVENVVGSSGNDELGGDGGANRLEGSWGDDILDGRGGGDFLVGGGGADVLSGGAGADSFLFFDGDTGTGSAADAILDFGCGGDSIDVSALDADAGASGDQGFTFIGDSAFSNAAGELRFAFGADETLIQWDVNGDGAADGEILLTGLVTLAGSDFML
jgi:Ca2+-binding RTX toxin-like protein